MRYLGIDYGLRRVGLSLSDETGSMAFPLEVLLNDKNLIKKISDICANEKVEAIVLGESMNLNGKPNPIMKKINEFKNKLEILGLTIYFEPEFMTSVEAERIQGKNKEHDASAATIILNSFISRNKKDDNN